MSGRALFKVDGRKFYASTNLARINSFKVKSIPRPYMVTCEEKEKPYNVINKLMATNSNNLMLIDKKVYAIHYKHIDAPKDKIFVAEATEDFKTLPDVIRVIDFLQKNQFTKGEKLIVVGGGIIQDVGAFVGACYKRGIPWLYIPTTLLSMCDSCIGGKTGINYRNAKNQLALFSAPHQVIINPSYLETLADREIKSGLGEILKLHITGGHRFLAKYIKSVHSGYVTNQRYYKELIFDALSIKKSIVETDEFELRYRKSLNYGHTIGHAIEVLSGYNIPHGQAVVAGIIVANEISYRRKMLATAEKNQMYELLIDLLETKTLKKIPSKEIITLLKKDKKTVGNAVNLVILNSIGDTRFLPLELNSMLADEISRIINLLFNTK